jgi:hypothetical protein
MILMDIDNVFSETVKFIGLNIKRKIKKYNVVITARNY